MRIAVMASGKGTILEALTAAGLPISLVVTDRKCRAISVAQDAAIPVELVERSSFGSNFDRLGYTKEIVNVLSDHEIDLIALAGFLTVFEAPIFERWSSKILNTHPSLLPAFPGVGKQVLEQTLAAGVKVTGCTVHVVTPLLDAGPILAQEVVPVLPGDTVTSLHERIKQVERRLYPQTIKELL